MIDGEKILITGATGKIAFPIARALAKHNEVWGAARLGKPGDGDRLAAAGVRALRLDMSSGDFSMVPGDFTYVFHAAVDPGAEDWRRCVRTNADHSGELMHHCRKAKGCSLSAASPTHDTSKLLAFRSFTGIRLIHRSA